MFSFLKIKEFSLYLLHISYTRNMYDYVCEVFSESQKS